MTEVPHPAMAELKPPLKHHGMSAFPTTSVWVQAKTLFDCDVLETPELSTLTNNLDLSQLHVIHLKYMYHAFYLFPQLQAATFVVC